MAKRKRKQKPRQKTKTEATKLVEEVDSKKGQKEVQGCKLLVSSYVPN